MRNKIIGAFIIIFCISVIYGLYEFNRGAKGIATLKVDEEITAVDLMERFSNDEGLANTNFLDKTLVVHGEVTKTEAKDESKSIFLATNDAMGSIICQLENINDILPEIGETIRIKGVCTGFLMDVVLIKSKIIE